MAQANHAYNAQPPLKHSPAGGSQEILTGEAGVYLVLSDLLKRGIPAALAMTGQPYDIIADDATAGVVRIQVKTTTRICSRKLRFRMQRGYYYSRRGNFDYGAADYDIAAFVHLPPGKLFFWASPNRNVAIPPEWLEHPSVARLTWLQALRHLQARRDRGSGLLATPNVTPLKPCGSSALASELERSAPIVHRSLPARAERSAVQ
jgi:hypothetical protein